MKNLSSSKPIKAVEALFGVVGIVMILVETYAVMARNILQISTPWSDELLKLLFVWSIFVCSALAFLNDELISLTLFEDDAKEKGKMALYGIFKVIQYVATLIISGLLVYQIWTIVNTQLSTGEATTVLKYPLWIMNSGILVGMVLTVVFCVIKLVDSLKYFKKNASEN
jgi:TRAP-type C4-dicarboxylate transport system permease small subunit